MANGTILKDKGKDWILLWKNSNASVSQTFAAQTVKFDKKNCVEFQVWFMSGIGSTHAVVGLLRSDGLTSAQVIAIYYANNTQYCRRRTFNIASNGMYFTDGSENTGTSNTSLIPYAIYGR